MSIHKLSAEDEQFRNSFEAFEVPPEQFDHEAHVRLAYAYLCSSNAIEASKRMKAALLAFLNHLGVGRSKYHETITNAWVDAVAHCMRRTPACSSFSEFFELNAVLGDSKIMLTHYSADVLFSDAAREHYVDPDIQPIPKL